MKKKLGLYNLGLVTVEVSTDDSGNGEFCRGKIVQHMTIGLGVASWARCLDILLHESFEMAAAYNHCRLAPDVSFGDSNDAYLFLMTHPQFAEICGQVALFVAEVIPPLAKRYQKCSKRK